jgi:tetratricopeptide (TPR) repeat protein
LIELGMVAIQTGYYPQALQALQEAERIAPSNAEVKHNLGKVYYHLNERAKAIEFYQKALALDPGLTDVHNSLGVAYMANKDYDKARGEFQHCLNDLAYTDAAMSRLNMGLLEENMNNPEGAIPHYQRLIANNEKISPSAYFRLGRIAYNKGDFRQAVDYLTPAVRQSPEYAEAFFLLGRSYEDMGYFDEAAENYGRCVVLEPNSALGIEAQKRVRNIMSDYN